MNFLWFFYGFPKDFLWISYGFPMDGRKHLAKHRVPFGTFRKDQGGLPEGKGLGTSSPKPETRNPKP